jgi:lactate dehydrogenase-like 2-hydroxyacid dehydrogenase
VEYAHAHGIPISNTPDVLNDCVADLALGLMIGVSRRLTESDSFVRAGNWSKGAFPLARSVHHKRLGIVGLGRVGNAIARRAAGFDMEIAYYNRKPVAGSPYRYFPTVTALAEWADFLVLSCVGGPSTFKLIGREQLAALGAQGILINVSRGTVVDEAALIEALSTGTLGGAGLDVYVNEPDVPDALKALPNTILLPHVGSATAETRRAM